MASCIVIGCGATKLDRPAPARELYVGQLFVSARRAAEATGLPWFILSAKHGLVTPETVLEPYDVTLRRARDMARAVEAVRATRDVLPVPRVGITDGRVTVDGIAAWCSSKYVAVLAEAEVPVTETPLRGLTMGRQRQWFARVAAGVAA